METKELMKQFTESLKKEEREDEKEIKLRRINKKKYCVDCKEIVEIKMKGTKGYCIFCGKKLYNIDTRKEAKN